MRSTWWLLALAFSPQQFISHANAQDDASDVDASSSHCIDLLSNKVSTCNTYQLATLNASPRRCIHIETPPPPPPNEQVPEACIDFPNYHDGTNGCDVYTREEHFCREYGNNKYPASPYKPNEACCACGGGNRRKPRLRVGDNVILHDVQLKSCKDLVIERILTAPVFKYVVKVNTGCGNVQRFFQGGVLTENYQFPAGAQLGITTDDETVIDKYYKVELRKCRMGVAAQEFMFQKGNADGSEIIILHKGTGSPLTTLMGATTPFVNITQVWEDGIFDGSGDYYVSAVQCNLFLLFIVD